jgi:hypothetical protein
MDKAVSQYVIDALRLCGQSGEPGRGISPEQSAEVTEFFNQLLDGWNSMRNALYSIDQLFLLLTSNIQYYLIGPGAVPAVINGYNYGAFNVARPQKITQANLIYQTSPEELRIPLKVIDSAGWADLRVPGIFAIPLELYCDYGYTQTVPTGLAQILLWPGPQLGYELQLFVWNLLSSTLGYNDTFYAPPGYARALTYNLALEILPLYRKGMNLSAIQMVDRVAKESRDAINSKNAPCAEAEMDLPGTGRKAGRSRFTWLAPLG